MSPEKSSEVRKSSPLFAVASIIVSMALLALSNGVIFTYVPIRMSVEGFAPWVAGAAIVSMSAGAVLGCVITGGLARRVGHARAFAVLLALVMVSTIAVAGPVWPLLWIAGRCIYGAAAAGLFVVTLSWLNHASDNEWRGRIIATFYMSYVVSIGAGGFALRFVEIGSGAAPLLSLLLAALAVLPICLTRLAEPPPPARIRVDFKSVARISPVGLAGMFAAGGLTMLVQGFSPIYAAAQGFGKDDVALLFFLMQLGLVAIQLPLGAVSDRVDRRYVLIFAGLLVADIALICTRMDEAELLWLIVVFAIWAGATESIYSVANAHANDRAESPDYIVMASTMLVAWSLSAFVLPLVATAFTPLFGVEFYMYIVIGVSLAFVLYVVYRVTRRESVPRHELEPYQHLAAQVPVTSEASRLPE